MTFKQNKLWVKQFSYYYGMHKTSILQPSICPTSVMTLLSQLSLAIMIAKILNHLRTNFHFV